MFPDFGKGIRMVFDHEGLVKLADAISKEREKVTISTDLGLTETELKLSDLHIDSSIILPILKKERGIFKLEDGRLRHLALFADGFYQLVATGEAPTVEIDGIQMHRTKEVKPFEDSRQKAATVVKKGDVVLDSCGGLGYTAIWALRLGAFKVDSCEPNENIRTLRCENPWSREFFDKRIRSHHILVQDFIATCEKGSYDCIIHDPPRFSLAGELYSAEFYQTMADILKQKGRLFHYTGNPYSHGRPRMFVEGIMKRLAEAGFKVKRMDEVLGVWGVKK
jgi:predicted methyltransferase